ncbi:MAG: hypothetical protein ABDH31_04835 [Chlorobiota bacterium]
MPLGLRGTKLLQTWVAAYTFSIPVFPESTYHWERGWIDTVITFRPGSGQNFGQDSAYYPRNIFGPPDTAARPSLPSANPHQILSLGMGGEIVVGFRGKVIVDGPGPDFVIFENAFVTPRGRVFVEPALVSVSKDGITWQSFPWDSLTLEGCAGRTPTNGAAQDLLDPSQSGGDWFDLQTLGIDSVHYVRITDLTTWLAQQPQHPFWDPTLSGFDLDAVGSRYLVSSPTDVRSIPETYTTVSSQRLLHEPCLPAESLGIARGARYSIFTVEGRCLSEGTIKQHLCLPVRGQPLLLRICAGREQRRYVLLWL